MGRVVGGRGGGMAAAYHLILDFKAKFSKRLHCDVGIKSTNVYTWQWWLYANISLWSLAEMKAYLIQIIQSLCMSTSRWACYFLIKKKKKNKEISIFLPHYRFKEFTLLSSSQLKTTTTLTTLNLKDKQNSRKCDKMNRKKGPSHCVSSNWNAYMLFQVFSIELWLRDASDSQIPGPSPLKAIIIYHKYSIGVESYQQMTFLCQIWGPYSHCLFQTLP